MKIYCGALYIEEFLVGRARRARRGRPGGPSLSTQPFLDKRRCWL